MHNGGGGGASFKDTAMDIYRNIRRYTSRNHVSDAERMANLQQGDNLKWQQDMYLRLMNMVGLHKEGLIGEEDVARFRQKILDRIVVCFDGGEFPAVTRDKLLFLQELLYVKCISEDEYHSGKKPLLYRLAEQGAEIDTRDIVLSSSSRISELPGRNIPEVCSKNEEDIPEEPEVPSLKSPANFFIDAAMANLKQKTKAGRLILPKDCPVRDPPKLGFNGGELENSDQCGSPLFYSPASSVESSSRRPMPTLRHKVVVKPVESDEFKVLSPKVNPDTVKIKKKLHSKGASTDFFIDKVLGQKIKKELERIRRDLRRTSPSQILTDDQIDAISTRLPADKAELMRFFPKSWCDRYGDIVLDVVQTEFKSHVKEMEACRRNSRRSENDENNKNSQNISAPASQNIPTPAAKIPSGNVLTPRKVSSFQASADYDKELDVKLVAEIQKLPPSRTRPLRC